MEEALTSDLDRDFHVLGKTCTVFPSSPQINTLFLQTKWATSHVDLNRDFHVLGKTRTVFPSRPQITVPFLQTKRATSHVDVNLLDLI